MFIRAVISWPSYLLAALAVIILTKQHICSSASPESDRRSKQPDTGSLSYASMLLQEETDRLRGEMSKVSRLLDSLKIPNLEGPETG